MDPSALPPPEPVVVESSPESGIAGRWRRLPPRLRIGLIAGGAVLALSTIGWGLLGYACPDVHRLTSYTPGGAPVLLDRKGAVFADLAPMEWDLVTLTSLPKHVSEAFIAVEDRRFREHGAVDIPRVFGALWANLRSQSVEEGFSTITMQLARNVFPERLPGKQRTLARKLLEIRVAQEIEDEFSKDQILEMYLNHIYFGNGARGIEAAARHYFARPAKELTLPQAALLAALLKAPSHYDPRRHPKEARERRDLVLTLMEEQKHISPSEAQAARKAPLGVARRTRVQAARAPFAGYFVEEARRELEEILGPNLYDEKLRVHTTLDGNAQRVAEEELLRQLQAIEAGALGRFTGPRYTAALEAGEDETPYLQGAVVAMDVATGDVRVWIGGRDFRHSRFDRVRLSRRQAGSAFKPFVYAAALASGRTLNQTLMDEPLRVSMDRRRVWEPRNFDGGFEGPVTLRDALVRSKNIPTIRLAQEVGYGRIAELAERAGVEPPIPQQPSMALGTVAVSPMELTAAFTAFAGMGEGVAPRLVLKVERANGEVLWEAERPERRRVLDPGVAYLITDALRDALVRGTGTSVRQAGFRGVAAGKTGTTNDGADAWFVGYTPSVVATVWMGFDRQRPIMAKATGGRLAAPVWARMMMRSLAGKGNAEWPRPPDVIEGWVDPSSGMLLSVGCRPWEGAALRELFVRGMAPMAVCPYHGEPQPLPLLADLELPDYEEGMQTGLEAEDVPLPPAPPVEERTEPVVISSPAEVRPSQAPPSPPSATPAPVEASPSPPPEAQQEPAPSPSPSPPL